MNLNSMDKNYVSLLDGLSKLYSGSSVPKNIRKVNKWQDDASQTLKYFIDGYKFTGSIFKCYKENHHIATVAFNDCRELNKRSALYFLKVFHVLNNK